ncbi:MAG: MFS transporter [Pseudosphingobacterium sp.]|nr:MFS transporter [Olivibacter sp. UJ_SKK_5.1]MDX3915339.1 MFS transporter [Pseudosphingobacterium sp.]
MNDQLTSTPPLSRWRRTAFIVTLFLVSAFSQIDRILPFILAESIKKELHLSDTQLGLINGIAFAAIYSVASLPLARLADRGASRQVLLWCVLIWSIMTGLGGLSAGFLTMALSRFGVALGEAGGTPASHALIAGNIPEHRRGRALGIFSMGIPLGTMIGFGVGGWASDHIGWRFALFVAGGVGLLLVILVLTFTGKTAITSKQPGSATDNIWSAGRELLSKPAFLWMFIGANFLGFAAAPFYAFTAPFLIRTHGMTASEVGLSFGLLQGLMGIIGTVGGGRLFDSALNREASRLLHPPAIVFSIAAIATIAGLLAPEGWMSIALFVPAMLAFAFLLPFAFGAGHLIAGAGKQALSSSLLMIASGLLGPALSPLLVGMISDAVGAAYEVNGLRWGMMIVPVASLLSSIALFIASRKIREHLTVPPRQNVAADIGNQLSLIK